MSNILFFDTETTGLAKFDKPFTIEHQPRLVQLGAILCDPSGRPIRTFCAITKPLDFIIPADVANCSHGIHQEYAMIHGIDENSILHQFYAMCQDAEVIVAHNFKFDDIIIRAAMHRYGFNFIVDNAYSRLKAFCTMLASTDVCCIKKNGKNKWPKLSEAYRFFFDEELKDAHDALTDVLACKRIYFEGLRMGVSINRDPRSGTMSQLTEQKVVANNSTVTIAK